MRRFAGRSLSRAEPRTRKRSGLCGCFGPSVALWLRDCDWSSGVKRQRKPLLGGSSCVCSHNAEGLL
jgi:hypothetical protein